MKSIACLLVLLAVAYGKPIIADQDSTSYSLSDTSKYLESIAHMAIVESLSPLHTSLSSLESSWINLVRIAIQEQVSIPQPTVPKIDVMSMLTCKAKYSPKYSMVLKYITDHQDQIQEHIVNAKKLEQDLKFTSQLVMYKKSDPDTKDAMTRVSQMVSDYLKDYSTTISSIKSTICRDQPDAQEDKLEDDHRDQTKPSHPLSEDYMETPLSLYLKGTMPLGAVVTKGVSPIRGIVDKGFSPRGGVVGKGYGPGGNIVGKGLGFVLGGDEIGKRFSPGGDVINKRFSPNGDVVGKGYGPGGNIVGKGFGLGGDVVSKGYGPDGNIVGKGFGPGGTGGIW